MKINTLGRTGPRSEKGKKISSMNALKHGGYAKTEVLPFEDAQERKRVEREVRKALQPVDAIEEMHLENMVRSLWTAERFKLRACVRQEEVFQQLTPVALAEMIDVPVEYRIFAPAYLKEPNTKFLKKDLRILVQRYQQYQHLIKHSKGIQNYQMVFTTYKVLFEGLDEFLGLDYGTRFLLSTGAGIEIAWQKNPKKVEEVLLEYAADLYYKTSFDQLRPSIRVWMASWYFIQKREQQLSDAQDELVIKELNRFQNSLASFLKYRRSRIEQSELSVKTMATKQANVETK